MTESYFFRNYTEKPISPYDHIRFIATFLEDLNSYINYWWENTETNITEQYTSVFKHYNSKAEIDITQLRYNAEKKLLRRKFGGKVKERYFINRYLKANGVYQKELQEKLNFTAAFGRKTKGRIDRATLKKEEDEIDRRVNGGLLDWLMNFLESLIEYFKLNHYFKEMLGIIKVFVSTLLL